MSVRDRGFAPSKLESTSIIQFHQWESWKLGPTTQKKIRFYFFPGIVNQAFLTSWKVTGFKLLVWKKEQEKAGMCAARLRAWERATFFQTIQKNKSVEMLVLKFSSDTISPMCIAQTGLTN